MQYTAILTWLKKAKLSREANLLGNSERFLETEWSSQAPCHLPEGNDPFLKYQNYNKMFK